MRTYTERFLDNLTTLIALLRGVAGVHSHDLMTSSCSLILKDIEKRAPGGVHDALRESMILGHVKNAQLLNGNHLVAFGILFGRLIVKVPPLAGNLEMRLGRTLSSLAAALAPLLPSGESSLLPSEGFLARAIKARISDHAALAISEEGLEPNIKTNVRMFTRGWQMLSLWLGFTHNQGVPVSISPEHQMTGLRDSFEGPMQLDLEGCPQLLGDTEVGASGGKLKVCLVLTQLDGVPSIRLFEAGEATLLIQYSQGKEPFEGFIQAISEHLDRGSGDLFATTTLEARRQIVLHEEFPRLLILCLGVCQHLIIEMPRRREAGHELAGLLFIWIQTVLKRSHLLYFNANPLICLVAEVSPLPQPQIRNAPDIPVAEARGFTARFGN
jgi:hypothetical protein